jgi:hypothetical protein
MERSARELWSPARADARRRGIERRERELAATALARSPAPRHRSSPNPKPKMSTPERGGRVQRSVSARRAAAESGWNGSVSVLRPARRLASASTPPRLLAGTPPRKPRPSTAAAAAAAAATTPASLDDVLREPGNEHLAAALSLSPIASHDDRRQASRFMDTSGEQHHIQQRGYGARDDDSVSVSVDLAGSTEAESTMGSMLSAAATPLPAPPLARRISVSDAPPARTPAVSRAHAGTGTSPPRDVERRSMGVATPHRPARTTLPSSAQTDPPQSDAAGDAVKEAMARRIATLGAVHLDFFF